MKEAKTKSIQIREDIHMIAKEYCGKKFLKLGGFIEELIIRELRAKNEKR